MELGWTHVAAAGVAIALGVAVLARRKGDGAHVLLGRAYLGAMVVVLVPVLFLYDATGRPGAFHALAVVSLITTGLGWLAGRRVRGSGARSRMEAHATLMAWSWIGLVTAGLAQAANGTWPGASPWPVLVVVALATATGAVVVPRGVARAVRTRGHGAG